MFVCICVFMFVCVCMCKGFISTCVCVYMFVCVWVGVCVHQHIYSRHAYGVASIGRID